jgi:hypothetical protein
MALARRSFCPHSPAGYLAPSGRCNFLAHSVPRSIPYPVPSHFICIQSCVELATPRPGYGELVILARFFSQWRKQMVTLRPSGRMWRGSSWCLRVQSRGTAYKRVYHSANVFANPLILLHCLVTSSAPRHDEAHTNALYL